MTGSEHADSHDGLEEMHVVSFITYPTGQSGLGGVGDDILAFINGAEPKTALIVWKAFPPRTIRF